MTDHLRPVVDRVGRLFEDGVISIKYGMFEEVSQRLHYIAKRVFFYISVIEDRETWIKITNFFALN